MKLKPLFIPFLTLVLCIGCKKEAPQQTVNNTAGVQQFSNYPFGIGREWHYNTTLTTYMNDTTVYNYVKVYRHLSDTVINGISCHKVGISNAPTISYNFNQYCYYANLPEGLHIIASKGNAGGFTWLRTMLSSKIKTQVYEPGLEPQQTDSIFILTDALHLTKLPIVYGQTWDSNEYGPQFGNKRKWIGPSAVTISLGSFSCVKLEFLTGMGNPDNFHVYQHFGDKGLIKTEMRQDSLLAPNGDTGYLVSTSELSYVNF